MSRNVICARTRASARGSVVPLAPRDIGSVGDWRIRNKVRVKDHG